MSLNFFQSGGAVNPIHTHRQFGKQLFGIVIGWVQDNQFKCKFQKVNEQSYEDMLI